MKIDYIFKLTMNEKEAATLKKVLGGLNDHDFEALGVTGEDRATMHELWDLLPDDEE